MARMSTFFCDVLFLLLLSLSKHCFQDSNEISAYTRSQTRATAGRHINSFIARPTSDAQLFQLRVRETTSKHARLSRIERIRKQILSPIVHLPFSLSLSSSASKERKRDLISISLFLSLSPPSLPSSSLFILFQVLPFLFSLSFSSFANVPLHPRGHLSRVSNEPLSSFFLSNRVKQLVN